jgi:SAM-dependent methyltransferase
MEPHELPQMFALEEGYWWYRALRRRIVGALDRYGAAAEPPRCLDAGCGTGMLLATLRGRVRAVGLDNSGVALALARRRGAAALMRGSIEALPLRDASQEIIISADVLYHRGVRDDLAALREMARCLKPGGLLILNLPAFPALRSVHDDAVHGARRYTTRDVRAKLLATGFVPLRVRYWNWILFMPIAIARLRRRRPQPYWERPATAGAASEKAGPHSDLVALPRWINALLDAILRLEERLDLFAPPAGLSVVAIARREGP